MLGITTSLVFVLAGALAVYGIARSWLRYREIVFGNIAALDTVRSKRAFAVRANETPALARRTPTRRSPQREFTGQRSGAPVGSRAAA